VIQDADRSLEAWLGSMLPPGVGVRFDAPDPNWARRPPERPFLDVFLYDIAEDTDGLTGESALVREPGGRAVAWQPPVHRYRLSYLLTAWSADVSADHELLGNVMAGCAGAAILPADCLRGTLLEAGLPVQLRCAPPNGIPGAHGTASTPSAGTAGLCQALGLPPRAALTLVLVAPVIPAAIAEVAPPARSIDLNMAPTVRRAGTPGQPVEATERSTPPDGQPQPPPRGQRRWERARITERPG
jgi:Pvc16 N-terminal domain